jgi:hypothetical protein
MGTEHTTFRFVATAYPTYCEQDKEIQFSIKIKEFFGWLSCNNLFM